MRAALPALLLALSLGPARCAGKEPQAPSPGFSLKQYQVTLFGLTYGFGSRDNRHLRAPQLPSEKADSKELRAFLVESDRIVREYFSLQGVELPPGTLACHDPASGTFVLRTTDEGHEAMRSFEALALLRSSDPCLVSWLLEILEAPEAAVRKVAVSAGTKPNHHDEYLALLSESRLVACLRGETKSGHPAATSSGGDLPTSIEDGNVAKQAPKLERPFGTRLELEAVVRGDLTQVDVNYMFEHQFEPSASHGKPESDSVDGRTHRIRPIARAKSSLVMVAPCTRLLGVWSLDEGAKQGRKPRMQAAFLRIAIPRVTFPPNHRVMQIVVAHGEAAVPSPKSPSPPMDSIPAGMMKAEFRVPADFESAFPEETVTDPFSEYLERTTPLAPGVRTPAPRTGKHKTAKTILEESGVPFPEGSWARTNSATNRLVVVNTPANLGVVQTYFEEMCGPHPPRNLNILLHIVQGEAALIRRLQQDTLASSEHSAAWRQIEAAIKDGKAKLLRTAWLETKPGAPARASQALEFDPAEFVTVEPKTEPAPTPAATRSDSPAPPPKPAEPDGILAGLDVEIEPILGADGWTLDLMIAAKFNQHAPDESALAGLNGAALREVLNHWMERHGTKIQLSTTLLAGSTRLISVWKPANSTEGEGDVLQAAFLGAEIANMDRDHER